MNLRDIRTGEMLTITYVLLDEDGNFRPILEGNSLLAEALDVIEAAHKRLLQTKERAGSNEQQIQVLTDEMGELDDTHDSLGRGTYKVLDGGISLARSVDEEQVFVQKKQKLFPVGLDIVRRSYREQAGIAKQVRDDLTDEDLQWLEGIAVGDATLRDHVEEWLDTAIEIAKKEAKRAQLRSEDQEDAVSAAEVRDARIEWIQGVHFLVHTLEFADIEESDKKALLANIKEAEQRAREVRRRAEAAKEADEADIDLSDLDEEADVDGDDTDDVVEPAE